ncbi:DUF4383 domain-containing protein [Hoyosella sp. G463]|uniref:DUF4383 domain-containing protein n=1 Tax=Lolliginicoccus lacisalsi TaxID=2742202 RepID=A0A927JD86_9ACTN|nr:DUF4383 domain-containing protein [Lolliginicoccus lacisalsi]
MTRPAVLNGKSTGQIIAGVFGAVFILVGILGFIPGITTNYDNLAFAGHGHGAEHAQLLGIFAVSVLHNIVHLLFGVVGLVLARTAAGARWFLLAGGAVYLVLWIYGLVIDLDSNFNFVGLNTADNWLHFVLGAVMVGAGIAATKLEKATS